MKHYILYPLLAVTALAGCDKLVSVAPPPDAVPSSQVFGSDVKAEAAVNGIYSYMMNPSPAFSSWMTTIYAGAGADELLRFSPRPEDAQFADNQIQPANGLNGRIWSSAYRAVYMANTAIEGLEASTALTPPLRERLAGECYFLRAFCLFYLTNLYGDIPLTLSSDYSRNKDLGRTNTAEVYAAVINDLEKAKTLLQPGSPGQSKGRANHWAATALLARAYLFTRNWPFAESNAGEVLETGLYTPLEHPSKVFLANSTEAIWQLVPDLNTMGYIPELLDAGYYPAPSPQFYLRPGTAAAFEKGDLRRMLWLDSTDYEGVRYYYPGKYKDLNFSNAEYYMVLRSAEQYLVRAEARTWLGNLAGAAADLNEIRSRAGLPALPDGLEMKKLLASIESERRSELFAEWGHRWLDLKRTGRANTLLPAVKGAGWQATDTLWPIPQAEITANIQLVQNKGY